MLVYENKIPILSFLLLSGSVSTSAFFLRGLQGSIYSSKITIHAPKKSILRLILFLNILFGAMEAGFLILMFFAGLVAGIYLYEESFLILWLPILIACLIVANYYAILRIRKYDINLRIWKQGIGLAHNASQMIIAYIVISLEPYVHFSVVIPILYTSVIWIILFRKKPTKNIQNIAHHTTFFPFRIRLMALACGQSHLVLEKEIGIESTNHNRSLGAYAKRFFGKSIIEKECARLIQKMP